MPKFGMSSLSSLGLVINHGNNLSSTGGEMRLIEGVIYLRVKCDLRDTHNLSPLPFSPPSHTPF